MKEVSAQTLRAWIVDGGELAILDAREEGEFGASHLFWATPCPLSQVEIRTPHLVPCRSVRIVCVDDARGLAESLAQWLLRAGYENVSVLAGGIEAWAGAGYELFSGVHVPSKAFGEWVEHRYGTKSVDAPILKQWLDAGRNMVVLDSRTFEEFHRMSIPSAMNVPGGELAYRIGDLAPDPDTLVVVNCAGRTRSIMGAESLRRAGILNKVVALRNGTMGWELAGLNCDRGSERRVPVDRPSGLETALERADAFARSSGVGVIDGRDLEEFDKDTTRTLYVLDVRDPREFREDHLTGSRSAPGGQLIQATDQWIAVRNSRVVLVDHAGVRSRMAAAWLRQMGHRDVFVLKADLASAGSVSLRPAVTTTIPEVEAIDPPALHDLLKSHARLAIVDLARSIDFREGHIPGSHWGVRTRLACLGTALTEVDHIVIAAPSEDVARLACGEVSALSGATIQVLKGGVRMWREAGFPLVKDRNYPSDEACIDFYLRPYDRNSGVEEAMKAYLSWEVDLVQQIKRDGTVEFSANGPETRPS